MALTENEIFIICKDDAINWKITKKLVDKDYTISTSNSIEDGLGMVYETPPALIMIQESLIKGKGLTLLKNFKQDNLFSHIPVILLVSPEWEKTSINWDNYPVEDYLNTAFKSYELLNRVSLCMKRFLTTTKFTKSTALSSAPTTSWTTTFRTQMS